jgi:diketogulonate reductase-like aldo/keto reductase
MAWNIVSTLTLNNGVEIPRLGLGVYQSQPGDPTQNAVRWALETGYRHIDTASAYENERDVGRALRQSGLPRQEVFVTTKLRNRDHGYDSTLRACDESLQRLGVERIDLYLIHWPVEHLRQESWRALQRLSQLGMCRAIGVSNYTVHHLHELLDSSDVVPAVNQEEFHPFLFQRGLLDFCRRNKIQLEAYSPLVRGRRLDDPTIVSLAHEYGQTPAQILIRWALQHDLVVIPKSVHRERIEANARVFDFELAPEAMRRLDALHADYHAAWDPTHVP